MAAAGDIIFGVDGAQLLYVRRKPLSSPSSSLPSCLSRCQSAHTDGRPTLIALPCSFTDSEVGLIIFWHLPRIRYHEDKFIHVEHNK